MPKKTLVTGATGNLGREVVRVLLKVGHSIQAGTRDVSRIKSTDRLRAVRLDYADPETFDEALVETTGVFLIAPPMDADAPAKLIPFIQKVKKAKVEHIVFNSAFGADRNERIPLRVIEHFLVGSGIPYTILRPNFFMENFSTGFIAATIRNNGAIFLAAGDGKTSFVSARDVANVAMVAFVENLVGKAFDLTGPEALDHEQVAQTIQRATGREITYQAISEQSMMRGARDNGMSEGAAQYMAVLYGVVRAGYAATVTNDVENVTGRKPMTFEEFVLQNLACWK
jgi:uncharacterized protein YbjT (DUF2867 family)